MSKPKAKMPRLCWEETSIIPQWPIRLYQLRPDNFTVAYGQQTRSGLTYDKACTELGAAIMHALSCEGVVDNRTREEVLRDARS